MSDHADAAGEWATPPKPATPEMLQTIADRVYSYIYRYCLLAIGSTTKPYRYIGVVICSIASWILFIIFY